MTILACSLVRTMVAPATAAGETMKMTGEHQDEEVEEDAAPEEEVVVCQEIGGTGTTWSKKKITCRLLNRIMVAAGEAEEEAMVTREDQTSECALIMALKTAKITTNTMKRATTTKEATTMATITLPSLIIIRLVDEGEDEDVDASVVVLVVEAALVVVEHPMARILPRVLPPLMAAPQLLPAMETAPRDKREAKMLAGATI